MVNARNLGVRDSQGRHIRVYSSLLNSFAYRVAGYASKALYFDLREKEHGSNNGNIEATLSTLRHKGWVSPATLAKALYELRALGFIAVTRAGGVEHGSRVCTLYRFTDLAVFEHPKLGIPASPPTHDYARLTTLQEAEAALRNGVQDLHAKAIERKQKAADRKKTTLQNLKRTDTETVALGPFTATESVAEDSLPLQNLKQQNLQKTPANPRPARLSAISPRNATRALSATESVLLLHVAIPMQQSAGNQPEPDPAARPERACAPIEKASAADRAPKSPTCQHPGCQTITLGREFCAKHRPRVSAQTTTRRDPAVATGGNL